MYLNKRLRINMMIIKKKMIVVVDLKIAFFTSYKNGFKLNVVIQFAALQTLGL